MNADIRQLAFKEKSGLKLEGLCGKVVKDSLRLAGPRIGPQNSYSSLSGDVQMDMDAFAQRNPGHFSTRFRASLGKHDALPLLSLAPSQHPAYVDGHSHHSAEGSVKGNLERLNFHDVSVRIPTVMSLTVEGYARNITDIKHVYAAADFSAQGYNLSFLNPILPGA